MDKKEKYYVIRQSEDGPVYVEEHKDLNWLLKKDHEGIDIENDINKTMPKGSETNYWDKRILIIKGNIVRLEPETVVTKYKEAK